MSPLWYKYVIFKVSIMRVFLAELGTFYYCLLLKVLTLMVLA